MATDWLRYANKGATRNQPLDPRLVEAFSFLPDMGLSMEVFSGGQPGKAEGGARVGSERHDHGGAGDAFFYQGDRKLDWANKDDLPTFEQIVQNARGRGVTGFGAGPGYMQPGSMHVGFGKEGVWGAGGSGANAPDWLRNAFGGGQGGAAPAPQGIQMAGAPPSVMPTPDAGGIMNMAQASATPVVDPAKQAWNFAETPIGQMMNGKFDVKKMGEGMTKGGMSDALSLIAGGMGKQQASMPSMAPPPLAHLPQVDPSVLSRIAMGR